MSCGLKQCVCFVLAPLVLAVAPLAQAQAERPAPFSVGETLTYDVSWKIFTAGQVSATLSSTHEGGRELYTVTTTAQSRGFVSLLFNVNDEFHSFFDPPTVCSLCINKLINEGRRHKDTHIVFDPVRKLALLDESDPSKPGSPAKHAENEIPACVEDVVSGFYFLRKQPLRIGEHIRVPVNDGSKTAEVDVEVQAREQVQTPTGPRAALRVEPTVFGDLYKRKGRMQIWFSDDDQKLPLRIRAAIWVGAITATLRSVSQQGTPSTAGQ